MVQLKLFEVQDWIFLRNWINTEKELIQFSGRIFHLPITRKQVKEYLGEEKRTVFKVSFEERIIGMAEVIDFDPGTAKFARILIGEKKLRGKGIGTQLLAVLEDYSVNHLKKKRIILNVYLRNTAAIRCYLKAGFEKTSKASTTIDAGNETWQSLEMEKII